MIPRYSRAPLVDIWQEHNKFNILLEIEILACEAQAKLGKIPQAAVENIKQKARFDLQRVAEIEQVTKHDIIAFLTSIAEHVGPEARFIHHGLTSSDILDTCLSIQLTQSIDILLADIKQLLSSLKKQAEATRDIPCIGRSHAIHAEVMPFCLKFVRFYSEFQRNYERLLQARSEVAVCAISGAVGNFTNIDPFVEQYVADALGLKIEPISTQVIPRDRHAMSFATFGVIASSIENVAVEIRHLQRSEVQEVSEFFDEGQKGSSAMPHKRNPILTENLTGLARIIRSYVTPALENVALWHERDISHSSVERFIAPDACITLDFALHRLNNVVSNLVVHPENIDRNLHKMRGLCFSQQLLLLLVEQGLSREEAYQIVQRNAMQAWRDKEDFIKILKADPEINKYFTNIEDLLSISNYNKHLDTIFTRVFTDYEGS